ncbi:hypothetical protein [Mycoplasma sp. P36-A1]|uniref:hypothetical protein n=1 Tax=Mycoplasma sp. P36-A1 TaxID=3252900 RepID=UPI003C2FF80C
MKKFLIYTLFYILSLTSIIISSLISYFLSCTITFIITSYLEIQISETISVILILVTFFPFFVAIFQMMQDLNYAIIHKLGYWARSYTKYSYRSFSFPQFYEKIYNTPEMSLAISKSKYTYRIFGVVQWVICCIVVEVGIGGSLLVTEYLHLNYNFIVKIILFLVFMASVILVLDLWSKLQKKLNLEIAYIENEREFYCKKSNDLM